MSPNTDTYEKKKAKILSGKNGFLKIVPISRRKLFIENFTFAYTLWRLKCYNIFIKTYFNKLSKKLLKLILPKIMPFYLYFIYFYLLTFKVGEDIFHVLLWSIASIGSTHFEYLLVMDASSWSDNQFQFNFLLWLFFLFFPFVETYLKPSSEVLIHMWTNSVLWSSTLKDQKEMAPG